MQKKLTVLFAFAIFVLIIGVPTDSYACDGGFKHRDPFPPCGGGSEDPESATVDLAGDMLTMDFPVSVIQDNSKKIHFENQNFNFEGEEGPWIKLVSEVDSPPYSDPAPAKACFVSRGNVTENELFEMVEVLKSAEIKSGTFHVEVDRKKITGFLNIQYDDFIFGEDEEQQIRIKYGLGAGFALDNFNEDRTNEEDGFITFYFEGTIIVWLTELNNPDQKIVACPFQTVNITLHRSAGQQ